MFGSKIKKKPLPQQEEVRKCDDCHKGGNCCSHQDADGVYLLWLDDFNRVEVYRNFDAAYKAFVELYRDWYITGFGDDENFDPPSKEESMEGDYAHDVGVITHTTFND